MQTYLVGGAVRDELLGLPVKDRDWVVVGATPEDMLALGFRRADSDFPVFLHPETGEEYTLARVEYKTGCGYKGFEVHAGPDVTLEQDLKRRDLTINAMAKSESGEIIDPFNGREDLEQGKLRHVSPAFSEDPLRVLRAARFAARLHQWGFRITHSTQRLMREIAESGEIKALSNARVWSEMSRALAERTPAVFFQVLHRCGALADCLPELEACQTTPDASHSDKSESGNSAIQLLSDIALRTDDPAQRFAALVWGMTQCKDASISARELCERFNTLSEFRDLAVALPDFASAVENLAPGQAEAILQILEAYSALRKPEWFATLLDTAALLPHIPQSAIESLHEGSRRASAVNAQPLIEQGLSGESLGKALRQKRIEAIQNI